MVSVDVKHQVYLLYNSDRAGVSDRNLVIRRAIPMTELRICVQVEVDVLGSPSLTVRTDCVYKATFEEEEEEEPQSSGAV